MSIYEGRKRRLSGEGTRYLGDAEQIAALPLPHVAAREAYLAVFHVAEAYIFEQTGKEVKTHRGVRAEFARLPRSEARIARDFVTFLGTAYQFKARADYAVGPSATPITQAEASAAMATAARFIDAVARVLTSVPLSPHVSDSQT